MAKFGEILKSLREELGLQQEDIRQILGLKTRQAISHWETGRYTPDMRTIQKLADYFKVDVEYLLGNSPYKTKLDKAQGDFFIKLGHMRQAAGVGEVESNRIDAALDTLLSELSDEVRKEFDNSLNMYFSGAILLEMIPLLKNANTYIEELYRMKIASADDRPNELAAHAIKGCRDICSGLESVIVEWTMTSTLNRQERVYQLFDEKSAAEGAHIQK